MHQHLNFAYPLPQLASPPANAPHPPALNVSTLIKPNLGHFSYILASVRPVITQAPPKDTVL